MRSKRNHSKRKEERTSKENIGVTDITEIGIECLRRNKNLTVRVFSR